MKRYSFVHVTRHFIFACIGAFAFSVSWFLSSSAHARLLVLADGRVLVTGASVGTDQAKVYDPVKNQWVQTAPANSAWTDSRSSRHFLTLLPDGRVHVPAAGIYDPQSNTIDTTANQPEPFNSYSTTTILNDGRIMFIGGESNTGEGLTDAAIFMMANNQWQNIHPMQQKRMLAIASTLQDNSVLVTGGISAAGAGTELSAVELYTPDADQWTQMAAMQTARVRHTATLLDNGKVLIVGGEDGPTQALNTVELYDPATQIWTQLPEMQEARCDHYAVLLPDNQVMVAGGWTDDGQVDLVEIYDHAKNQWSRADASWNWVSEAVPLPDGRLMVTRVIWSLENGEWQNTQTIEIYNPQTKRFTVLASTETPMQ